MRPDRIIVGEVRGAEALDMLQAMNTGHDGSLSHGPRQLLARRPVAHRDDGPDGRLRPADPRDPPAGGLGAGPGRPPGAPGRRHAPRHRGHRDPAHGGRRHHDTGPLRLRDRRGHRRRDDPRRAASDRPAPDVRPQARTPRARAAEVLDAGRGAAALDRVGSARDDRRSACSSPPGCWPPSPPRRPPTRTPPAERSSPRRAAQASRSARSCSRCPRAATCGTATSA